MIYYELKIESEGEAIEITEPNKIYAANVILRTVNFGTQKKSNAILMMMKIDGIIDETTNDSLLKISEWARDLNATTTYRKVTLTVKSDDTGKILRTYEVPYMFVDDYEELYGSPEDKLEAHFELKISQSENRLKEFNTY